MHPALKRNAHAADRGSVAWRRLRLLAACSCLPIVSWADNGPTPCTFDKHSGLVECTDASVDELLTGLSAHGPWIYRIQHPNAQLLDRVSAMLSPRDPDAAIEVMCLIFGLDVISHRGNQFVFGLMLSDPRNWRPSGGDRLPIALPGDDPQRQESESREGIPCNKGELHRRPPSPSHAHA